MTGTQANHEEPKPKSSEQAIIASALVLGALGAFAGEGGARSGGEEVLFRGLQALVGAGIGATLAYLLTIFRARKRQSRLDSKLSNTSKGDTSMTATDNAEPVLPSFNKQGKRFGWLTDVRFNNFVTPGIVSVFYLLSLVIIGLGAVVYWLNTIEDSLDYEGAGGAFVTALWTAPIIVFVALLAALLVRLIFESIMVVFRIAEDLRRIRDK